MRSLLGTGQSPKMAATMRPWRAGQAAHHKLERRTNLRSVADGSSSAGHTSGQMRENESRLRFLPEVTGEGSRSTSAIILLKRGIGEGGEASPFVRWECEREEARPFPPLGGPCA